MEEVWKDIINYEGYYQVSNLGRIRRIKPKIKIMNPYIEKFGKGYAKVAISKPGEKRKFIRIHQLVCQAFIQNLENKPHINHIDCNKSNNKSSNLEWVTNKENMQHASNNKLMRCGENHNFTTLTEEEVLHIIKLYESKLYSQEFLSKKFKVSRKTIGNIVNKKTWKHI